jgi:hypothetical protein
MSDPSNGIQSAAEVYCLVRPEVKRINKLAKEGKEIAHG